MFAPQPPQRLPHDMSPSQRQYARRTHEQLAVMARYQGVNVAGGTMPTQVPDGLEWIFGQIRAEGSGSGSGSFSLDPAGTGFTDEEGYLAYAFDQIYDDYPWKGIVIANGITTTLPHTGVSGANYAYPLNQDTFDDGVNVILKKAGLHWVIIGTVGESGSGSGSGTRYNVTCNADGSVNVSRA